MQDLAGFRVAPVIHVTGLELPQLLKCSAREAGIYHHVLEANDETVAAEYSHEPWDSGRRQPFILIRVLIVKPQSTHIFDRLPKDTVYVFVGRDEDGRLLEPLTLKRVETSLLSPQQTRPFWLFWLVAVT